MKTVSKSKVGMTKNSHFFLHNFKTLKVNSSSLCENLPYLNMSFCEEARTNENKKSFKLFKLYKHNQSLKSVRISKNFGSLKFLKS